MGFRVLKNSITLSTFTDKDEHNELLYTFSGIFEDEFVGATFDTLFAGLSKPLIVVSADFHDVFTIHVGTKHYVYVDAIVNNKTKIEGSLLYPQYNGLYLKDTPLFVQRGVKLRSNLNVQLIEEPQSSKENVLNIINITKTLLK